MDILISNLLAESILEFGKWSNGKYTNTHTCVFSVFSCRLVLGRFQLLPDTLKVTVSQSLTTNRWTDQPTTRLLELLEAAKKGFIGQGEEKYIFRVLSERQKKNSESI